MTEIPPIQSFEEFEAATESLLKGPYQSRFGRVSWRDLDAPGPAFEYLIDGWLTVGDKSVIGGPSKSGKSFLAIHAAMCIARGLPFFGQAVRQGLVIYQAGEGARGVRRKRLPAYRRHFRVPDDENVPFELLTSQVDLYHPEGDTKGLIEEIQAIKAEYPDLPLAAVFIDTLATATGGADENSGRDMGTVMKNIATIERECGCHVVLVHHMNAGGTKLRGHTSIYANVDQVILVTRDEDTKVRTAVLDKQKDDEDGIRIQFELMAVKIGAKPDGSDITSCVCLEVGQKAEIKKQLASPGFKLNDTEHGVFEALMKALKADGEPAPDNLNLPPGRLVVRYGAWKAEYAKIAHYDQSDPKKFDQNVQKALERVGKTLMRYGVIGRERPFVWWAGKPIRGFPETAPAEPAAPPPPSYEQSGDDIGWT